MYARRIRLPALACHSCASLLAVRTQLDHVATPAGDLLLHQMTHLLAILMGADNATRLARAVLGVLEEGIQESWYERKLRRMHGGPGM